MRSASPIGLRGSVAVVFALNGVLFGSLFVRIPAIKADLGLGEAALGLALFAGAAGLILSQPTAGALITRIGSRPLVRAGLVLYGVLLLGPALAPSVGWLAAAMFALGAGSGLLDVAMNVQGAAAEARSPRRVFASFHAAFSFGGLLGAALGGLAAAVGAAPVSNFAIVGAAAIAVGLIASRPMLPRSTDVAGDAPLLARPRKPLLALAAVAVLAVIVEGSVSDWSAVLLHESRGASPGVAAAGLAVFSLCMGIGRLAADPIAERWGSDGTVRAGALAATAGVAIVVAVDQLAAAIAGYAVAGLGVAALFPLALRAASRIEGETPATAIAAISTTGYVGFLAGPALIGLLAEASSLPLALAMLLPLCAAITLLAGRVAVGEAGDRAGR